MYWGIFEGGGVGVCVGVPYLGAKKHHLIIFYFTLIGLQKMYFKINFESFEAKHGFEIPLSFKLLNNAAILSSISVTVFDEIMDHHFQLSTIKLNCNPEFAPQGIVIDTFLPDNKLLEHWENHILGDALWGSHKLLPFAHLAVPAHTKLFLGVSDENYGKIFVNSNDEMIYKSGNNIYELYPDYLSFLGSCENQMNEDSVIQIAGNSDNLYRCWGEDFWRIKR